MNTNSARPDGTNKTSRCVLHSKCGIQPNVKEEIIVMKKNTEHD